MSDNILSAEDFKTKGNECFKEKRFHKAVSYYSKSLEQKLDPVVLSNRSQAYLAVKYYEAALTDASESIRLNPDFPKSYYRRAQALTNLGIHSKARTDLKRVLALEPDNKAAQELSQKISITFDKPIVPIEVYDKNPYVRSCKPLTKIQIRDSENNSAASLPFLSEAPSPSKPTVTKDSDTSSGVSTIDDEPLPSPAVTNSDFAVAHTTLNQEPVKFVEYFLTIPTSSFEKIFEPGVEIEWVETLLTGLGEGFNSNEQIVYSLDELSKSPRFELCAMFLSDKLKSDLKTSLQKFSSSLPSLVSNIMKNFQVD